MIGPYTFNRYAYRMKALSLYLAHVHTKAKGVCTYVTSVSVSGGRKVEYINVAQGVPTVRHMLVNNIAPKASLVLQIKQSMNMGDLEPGLGILVRVSKATVVCVSSLWLFRRSS